MALTSEERKTAEALKKAGKSSTEIARIIAKQRTGVAEQPQTEQQPGYFDTVKQAAGAAIGKIGQGIEEAKPVGGGGIGGLITGVGKIAGGAAEFITSPAAPALQKVGEGLSIATSPISNNPAVQKFAMSPAGQVTTDVAQTVADYTNAAGLIAGGPKAIASTKRLFSEATEALGDITEAGVQGIESATSKGLNPASLMQRVARVSKGKQVAFEERAGTSVGQYLVDRGIFGTPDKIVDQLYTRFQQSMKTADDALATLQGTHKNTAVGVALKELATRERTVSSPGAISKDLERVQALQKKHLNQGLTMREINEVKRLYERNVKLDYIKENLPVKVEQANNVDSAIRQWQLSTARQLGLKNLDEINKETMLARQLADDLGAEYSGQAGNNAVSITDWITLSGGTTANAAMFLTKKALTSKIAMSFFAEKMAGSTPKIGAPQAVMEASTIDNYLNFIQRTDPKVLGGGPKNAMDATPGNIRALDTKATAGDKSAWPTTASKPSKAGVTSTGNAPIGKEGVSAQRADTSGLFDGFQRQPNLSPADRTIEDASVKKYLSHKDQLISDYTQSFGKVANADLARRLFKDVGYNGKNSAAVHEAASALSKDVLRALVTTNKEPAAVYYAGGSGTGKSSVVNRLFPDALDNAAAVLDGNLSKLPSALKSIKIAQDAGKQVKIIYVYRDPVDAWINGVVKRMNTNADEAGRVVPLSTFLENHPGSHQVVKELMDAGFDVQLIDNSLGSPQKATILSHDKFNQIRYNVDSLRKELTAKTKELLDRGTITKEQYDALID
jgi:hypothetical protein